ncbi:MAG: transglutaminase-like putative cysteine protease [Candidatus Azotimanducaceae bacterium]
MTSFQIPRNSLGWLLAAQIAVIAPHFSRLPIWVALICAACVLWRVMVFQGRWSYPGRWTKALMVVGGLVGIGVGYQGRVYGLEPAVALLVIAFVLKLLEMHHKRDAYIVILLGYFVAITEFLFFQTIPYALYMLFAVTLITAALIGLNQTQSHHRPMATFTLAARLLAQSMPMMLVLFVLFPRITPLWTVPLESQAAKTGVTDSMNPGDIASLTQSADLAFKATFSGDLPGFSQLYWRGLVLEKYDGRRWSRRGNLRDGIWRDGRDTPRWKDTIERSGRSVSYSVILEPTQQNWLFSLSVPRLPATPDVAMLSDFTLAYAKRLGVSSKFKYEVISDLDYILQADLADDVRARNTQLPDDINPRARALAKSLRLLVTDDADYVRAVMVNYNDNDFVYTLQPPALGDNDIDEFLFDTQRGFCEHYAGSFVFMMRAAGIPARVVLGYQGGEYNSRANYIAVRQFDAHAWAEVWYEGRGWVRVDPTQMVAPERIEGGLESAVSDEETFLSGSPLSLLKYRQLLWLSDLRQQVEAVGHYWDNWVVGYNPGTQMALLSQYFDDVNPARTGVAMLSAFFTLLGIVGLFVLGTRSTRVVTVVDQQYLRFCHLLHKQGLARELGEGPFDYGERIKLARPDLADAIERVTKAYVALNYASLVPGDIADLKKAVTAFRLKALTANV